MEGFPASWHSAWKTEQREMENPPLNLSFFVVVRQHDASLMYTQNKS